MTLLKTSAQIRVRFAAAFILGMIIPGVINASGHPLIAMALAAVAALFYSFERRESQAAVFGALIALLSCILIMGSLEASEQTDKPVEIMPAW